MFGADHRGLHRGRLFRSDPHRRNRPQAGPGLRRPVPLRPRGGSRLRRAGPGAGDAADPGALRRRGLRGADGRRAAAADAAGGLRSGLRPSPGGPFGRRRGRARDPDPARLRGDGPRRAPARPAAQLAARCRGARRPGRGSGPHRQLRRPALHAPAGAGAAAGRRADRPPGSRAARPSHPGGPGLSGGGHLVLHLPRGGRAVRRRPGKPGAGQSHRRGPGLHAALDPAQPDRGGRA